MENLENIETTEAAEATEATAPAENKNLGVAELGIIGFAVYGAYCALTDGSKAIAKGYKKLKVKRAAKKAAAKAAEAQSQTAQTQTQTAEQKQAD